VTYDPTAAYRSAQVTTSSPAHQVVLLYEGAIRFSAQCVQKLQARDLEGAHVASVRAQAIISALRESLDLSAGDVAIRLDALYDFMLRRLVAANVAKEGGPVVEVIDLLRGLLEGWREVAAQSAARPAVRPHPQPGLDGLPAPALPGARPAPPFVGVPVATGPGLAGAIRA
jgi:flagellar protein FliS